MHDAPEPPDSTSAAKKFSAAHQPFNPANHPGIVRPSPEHAPAVDAPAEFGLGLANAGWKQILHFVARCWPHLPVANHAPCEWPHMRAQRISFPHFAQLL